MVASQLAAAQPSTMAIERGAAPTPMSSLLRFWQKGHAVDWATVQYVDGNLFFVGNKNWNAPSESIKPPYQLYRLQQPNTTKKAQTPARVVPVRKDDHIDGYTDWKVDVANASDTCLRVLRFGILWSNCPPAIGASLRPANDYGVLPMFDDFGLAAVDSLGKQLYWAGGAQPWRRPAATLPSDTVIHHLRTVNQAGLTTLWISKAGAAARDGLKPDSLSWVYDAQNDRFVNRKPNQKVVFLRPDVVKLQSACDSSWQFMRLAPNTRALVPIPGPASFRAVEALDITTGPAPDPWRYAAVDANGTLYWYREKPDDPDTLQLAERHIEQHQWLPGGKQALVRTLKGWQVCTQACNKSKSKTKTKTRSKLCLEETAFDAIQLWPLTAKWILRKQDSSAVLDICDLQGAKSYSTTIAASADSLLIASTSTRDGDIVRVCWREVVNKSPHLYFQFFLCSSGPIKEIGPKHAAGQFFPFGRVLISYGETGQPSEADSAQVWDWAVPYRKYRYALDATRPIELPAGSGTYYWPAHRQQAAKARACILELASPDRLNEYTQLAALEPANPAPSRPRPASPAPRR